MPQTRGGVICGRYYGSSKDRAVTANSALCPPTPRLPDNLSDTTEIARSEMTDVLTCSCRLQLAA